MVVGQGNNRFVPVNEREILIYSSQGATTDWKLPPGWSEQHLTLIHLTAQGDKTEAEFQVKDGQLRFQAQAKQPYLLTKGQ